VRGRDETEWRQREQVLTTALADARNKAQLIGWRALSDAVPSATQQQANIQLLTQAFAADGTLHKSLLALEFAAEDISALQQRTLSASTLDLTAYLALPQNQPQRMQWLDTKGDGVASIVLLDGIRDLNALASLQLDGVVLVDKTASISALFKQFREQATRYVLLAYVVTLLWLLWQVGVQGAFVRLLPTALASGMTLALLGYLGQPFNLFTGIALLLVLGIGIDYALFLAEGEGHEPASLLAILLSALTAVLGFGLLVGASLPAVSGFGLTVLIGVLLALLLAPLTLVLMRDPA
jgi:predicted exporter